MPSGLKRRYGLRHLHFITCSCYRRLPLLASARAKNSFVKILGEVRDRYGFALVGYVVMPEHIHRLISEPPKGTPSTVLQVEGPTKSGGMILKFKCSTDVICRGLKARPRNCSIGPNRRSMMCR
jgi:REP element-mobilizing transposase RayT